MYLFISAQFSLRLLSAFLKKKSWKDFLFNSWALTRELIFWIIFVPQYIIKAFIFNCICQPRTNNVYVKMSRHYRKCSDYTSIFAFLATLNAVLKIVSFLINLRWFRKITNLLTSSFHVNHLNCFYANLEFCGLLLRVSQ